MSSTHFGVSRRSRRTLLARSLSLLAVSSPAFALTTNDTSFCVQVRTDFCRPVPGAAVQIEYGATQSSFTTGIHGRSGAVQIPSANTAVVSIGTARTPLGSTVGQVLSADVPATTSDIPYREFIRFVPEARTVQFIAESDPSVEGFLTQDDYSESWYAHPFASSPGYDFSAGVALLRSPGTIDAYFAYHQTSSPQTYIHGLLIRTIADVDLAGDRICLAIGRDTHQYVNPSVDVVHISSSTGTGASVTLLGEDSEFTYVALEGTLLRGDTLVLIRVGGNGGPGTLPPDPVQVPPAGGGMLMPPKEALVAAPGPLVIAPNPYIASAAPPVLDEFEPCPLSPPSDQAYCADRSPGPAPDNDCGATQVTGAGESRSDIVPAWSGNPPCNDNGITKEKQICWEVGGGVEFGFQLGDVVNLNVNGEVTRVKCTAMQVAPCLCVGTWTCDWETTQWWRVCREYTVWVEWFTFETRQHWSRKPTTVSGREAIEQETTCTVTTGNCSQE